MRRVVMVVLDGLRRDFVTEANTPNLVRFARQAEHFPEFRTAFPSATRAVSATVATGCHPARHTLQGNAVALPEHGILTPRDVGDPDFLRHKRAITGVSLAVPTLAERLAPHGGPGGGAVIFNNVSPGAAFAHDPDGFGHVYHRVRSMAPGGVPADDPLKTTLDAAGDTAMTERFIADALPRNTPYALLWCGEPDHIQHNTPLGSPEHLATLRQADANAGRVIEAVARLRDAGDDVLLIVASDHGHETVSGVVDIDAELAAARLKANPDSTDVLAMGNGTGALIYLDPAHASRRADLEGFLRAQPWCGALYPAQDLGLIGQAPHYGLAFAVSMAADESSNGFGVPGRSLTAKPRWDKPDRVGFGQHGGLGRFEQSPILLIDGDGFLAGGSRDQPAHVVDLAPSIMRHVRLAAPGMAPGMALGMDGAPLQSGP